MISKQISCYLFLNKNIVFGTYIHWKSDVMQLRSCYFKAATRRSDNAAAAWHQFSVQYSIASLSNGLVLVEIDKTFDWRWKIKLCIRCYYI